MVKKLYKGFFSDNEVLLVGYPVTGDKSMLGALLQNGIKAYAANSQAGDNIEAEIKVYKSLAELPKVPKCAYFYPFTTDIQSWIDGFAAAGVTKVLFFGKKTAAQYVEQCEKANIEVVAGCPLMILAGGIHKLHARLASIK